MLECDTFQAVFVDRFIVAKFLNWRLILEPRSSLSFFVIFEIFFRALVGTVGLYSRMSSEESGPNYKKSTQEVVKYLPSDYFDAFTTIQ